MESPDIGGGFSLSNINFRKGNREVFRNLDITVQRGEIHALVSDKGEEISLLCSLLRGKKKPDAGVVLPKDIADRASLVTKTPQVFPNMTVGENLTLRQAGGWFAWLQPHMLKATSVKKWLAENSIVLPLDVSLKRVPKEDWLFVQILNRLYQNTELLIIDGALEELSALRTQQLWPLLERHVSMGMSLLWVSDDIDLALIKADRISILRNGEILVTDSTHSLDRIRVMRLCYGFLDEDSVLTTPNEQFRQVMRFTEALFRDLPFAVVIIDNNHTVRFINQGGGKLFNVPTTWIMERGLAEIFGAENAAATELLNTAIDETGDREWHSIPILVNGENRLADMRMRKLSEGDTVIGYMLVVEDVSVREEMRRRLVLSENLASIGLLAGGVAHEVNNPLEVMENYLNYLTETESNQERREVIEQIIGETRGIRETVRQLVAFSGQRSDRRVKTDMSRLSKELTSLLRYGVTKRDIRFSVVAPERRILVTAAPNEMRQMLLNLLRNSMDAMPEGGEITIRMKVRQNDVGADLLALTVEDSGSGIEESEMASIFLPFVSSKSGGESHQGLGLSIVHSIVENCQGKISVENRSEGGTRFTIELPCLLE